jgi:hypothetical protein
MLAAKAAPDARRHMVQWQSWIPASSPATSNLTAPQRHPPICIVLLLVAVARPLAAPPQLWQEGRNEKNKIREAFGWIVAF